mgnify:CR=1 FL=1|jgi:hypothetical protein
MTIEIIIKLLAWMCVGEFFIIYTLTGDIRSFIRATGLAILWPFAMIWAWTIS